MLWAGAGSALSHQTAAALWRLEGFPPGPVVLTTTRALKPAAGIAVHRVAALHEAAVTTLDGTTVTTPARSLLDLAAVESPEKVERALDAALTSRLVSLPKLRRSVETCGGRGRPGTAVMRRLLLQRPAGYIAPESPLERKVWDLLLRAGLPPPVRQHEMTDRGRRVARVDLAYPEARVAVEVDGYRWHTGRQTWAHDLARRNRISALGWRVLHVTHEDLTTRPHEVVDHLRSLLASATSALQAR